MMNCTVVFCGKVINARDCYTHVIVVPGISSNRRSTEESKTQEVEGNLGDVDDRGQDQSQLLDGHRFGLDEDSDLSWGPKMQTPTCIKF